MRSKFKVRLLENCALFMHLDTIIMSLEFFYCRYDVYTRECRFVCYERVESKSRGRDGGTQKKYREHWGVPWAGEIWIVSVLGFGCQVLGVFCFMITHSMKYSSLILSRGYALVCAELFKSLCDSLLMRVLLCFRYTQQVEKNGKKN